MKPALLLLALLACATGAAAHTTYTTPDGSHRIVVGHLNEPVTTWTKTGLDLSIQQNNEARTPVTVDPSALTATLVAPDGTSRHTLPLVAQFGRTGAYTFEEPYVLTQPGQYVLELSGDLHGVAVNATINVAGPIDEQATVTFPDRGAPSPLELEAGMEGHAQQLAALQARVDQLEAEAAAHDEQGAPAVLFPVAIVALALLAAFRRRA